jgi:mannose-6-phosphate isomerase-like protein (cupin superfamily)
LTNNDVYFAIPAVSEGYTANDFSKYKQFVASSDLEKNEPLTKLNTKVSDRRQSVKEIVDRTRTFLQDCMVQIPNGAILEISHHYGIENFYETGLSMITVVNEEYCKKLLFLLPGQSHPEQFHKNKKETFHVIHGDAELYLDGDCFDLRSGDVQTIKQLVRHRFFSKNGCVIEEISSTHDGQDSIYTDEQINKNENRKTLVNFWV